MSRPIYEPSLPRADAENAYSNRQLFRRPAPQSGCNIEYFRAYRYVTPMTVPSGGSSHEVDWDFWEFCNEEVFQPLKEGSLDPDPVPGVDRVSRIDLDVATFPGRYTFYFGAVPDSSINGSILLTMHDGDDTWGYPDGVIHGPFVGGLEPSFLALNINRILPMADPFGGSAGPMQISFQIAHTAATSEDFDPCWMEIHYESCVIICPPDSS